MQSYLFVLKNCSLKNYSFIITSGFLVLCFSVALGAALGKLLSLGAYVGAYEPLITNDQPLPSRIYDINNNLITEISQGSRELLAQNELTRNLIYALMGREDSTFFQHNGFSLIGTMRAFTYVVLDKIFNVGRAGGGSTLTQQLAGSLKADRTDISLSRKIQELWWSFIFEKYYSKSEILVTYLNNVYFGDRNYGIEAASRFFFGHSARENSIVEAVLAVIQLARPNGDFSPLRNPEMAKLRQEAVLGKIVTLGLMTQAQVQQASQQYWDSFDLTKVSQRSPKRVDEAPYFSDYVARILEQRLYGTNNLLQAGYSIYTTLDLNLQKEVDKIVAEEMDIVDRLYQRQNLDRFTVLERQELPGLARLRLLFGLINLNLSGGRDKRRAEQTFQNEFAPTLEVLVSTLGLENQLPLLKMSVARLDKFFAKTVPETALLAVDNRSGNIVAMVGGRTYNINEARLFNRAIDARVPMGSSIKPLYFAAAFEERVVNGGTLLGDVPYRFVNPNGDPYIPANYHVAKFRRSVLPRKALQLSLNIPAIHVLDMVGFNKGVNTVTGLLGVSDMRIIRRDFPFVFPIGLGISPVAPIQLLRSYTVFANRGIPIEPNPIRYVEDRNGQILFNYEKENLSKIQDSSRRILSEQTAYVMTKMLESVPSGGTLNSAKLRYEEQYGRFAFPLAAKTGTAENWSDGWTVGYTPNYTIAVWVGFDQAGNSLGESLYGGKAAGPMFMRVMGLLHKNKDTDANFEKPKDVYAIALDKRNGYRWVPACGEENKTYEWFLQGTGPNRDCTQAPRTEVFNFDIISAYPINPPQQKSETIDISSFDFLNEPSNLPNDFPQNLSNDFPNNLSRSEVKDTAARSERQKQIRRNNQSGIPENNPQENFAPNLEQNFAENSESAVIRLPETRTETVPQTMPTEPVDSGDSFLQRQQDTRSELDSIIEFEN